MVSVDFNLLGAAAMDSLDLEETVEDSEDAVVVDGVIVVEVGVIVVEVGVDVVEVVATQATSTLSTVLSHTLIVTTHIAKTYAEIISAIHRLDRMFAKALEKEFALTILMCATE